MNISKFDCRHFTIRQADQMLPLVRLIATDIVELTEDVKQTRERLDCLSGSRLAHLQNDIYRSEVLAIERLVDQKSDAIDAFVYELTELEVKPSLGTSRCVDFPARRKDETVCLCWKLGEASVKYWHRSDEDCSQRRLVDLELIRQSGDHAFV